MTRREKVDRAALARGEVANAEFGDRRLSRRLEQFVEALAQSPGESLPNALGGEAPLEGAYRLLGNEKVTIDAILGPHVEQTVGRCAATERVLAVFDTTEFRYSGERDELGYLSHEKSRGVYAHIGLTVNPTTRDPLGVLQCETWVRRGPKKSRKEAKGAADSEALRWNRGVETVFGLCPEAICVMDREADIYALVVEMHGRGQNFIIRAAQNRATPEGPLWDLLDEAELVATRTIEIPERRARKRKALRGRYPTRSAHEATLELRARKVTLQRPVASRKRDWEGKDAPTHLHLIHVIESHPPPGDEPIEWVLLSSLPIGTKAEVEFIVDAYSARWVIEEFFKALKSGCAVEKRQLEGLRSINNLLAASLPIAWLLLRLRHLSRDEPQRPAIGMISPVMMTCLRIMLLESSRRALPEKPTCRQLTWAIAGLGGHITNNGEPGLIVLARGLAKLIAATDITEAFKRTGQFDSRGRSSSEM